jgi:hypothetical protein
MIVNGFAALYEAKRYFQRTDLEWPRNRDRPQLPRGSWF